MRDPVRKPPRPAILLVEDNPDDIILTRRALSKAGVEALLPTVTDGDAAVRYLEGADEFADRERSPIPLLVLLDWKLPRRSGLEVLTWIRSRPALAVLPVVVLTSSRQQEDIEQAYRAGANSYLEKPVEFAALVGMLERVHLYWLRTNVTCAHSPRAQ